MPLTAPKMESGYCILVKNKKMLSESLPVNKTITVSTSLLRVPLSADSTLVIARAVQVFLLNITVSWDILH